MPRDSPAPVCRVDGAHRGGLLDNGLMPSPVRASSLAASPTKKHPPATRRETTWRRTAAHVRVRGSRLADGVQAETRQVRVVGGTRSRRRPDQVRFHRSHKPHPSRTNALRRRVDRTGSHYSAPISPWCPGINFDPRRPRGRPDTVHRLPQPFRANAGGGHTMCVLLNGNRIHSVSWLVRQCRMQRGASAPPRRCEPAPATRRCSPT